MSDKLHSDQYYIRNSATGAFASRNQIEDRSGYPKAVFSPPDKDHDLFDLEALSNGRYKLKARGAPTGVINGLLYAFIGGEEDGPEEWIITKRQDSKEDRSQYTIETAAGTAGWVSNESTNQVAVHKLIATLSLPPQFPTSQLWSIQPLVE